MKPPFLPNPLPNALLSALLNLLLDTDFFFFSGGDPLKPPFPTGAPTGETLFFLFFSI